MIRSSRRHRGMSLLEILAALTITSAFLTLASRLVFATACLSRDSASAQTDSARFDSALAVLRRDVWNARQIAVPDPHQLLIEDSSGSRVTWQSDKDAALIRIASNGQTHWPASAHGLTFSRDGDQVVLDVKPDGQLRLVPLSALTRSKP